MRLHRFFVQEGTVNGNEALIRDPKILNQWRNVFRYTTGSRVLLFDGTGAEYLALIASINPDRAELQILEKEERKTEKPVAGQRIHLFMSIIKNNNFDLVLQKAAEIGVDVIVPIVSDRVIKKSINMERSKRILIEASEQSGHITVPELSEPQTLVAALDAFEQQGGKPIICQAGATGWNQKLIGVASGMGSKFSKRVSDVSFVIGPEGGWSSQELEYFKKKKYTSVSLGARTGSHTLRAETAAIAVLALVQLQ